MYELHLFQWRRSSQMINQHVNIVITNNQFVSTCCVAAVRVVGIGGCDILFSRSIESDQLKILYYIEVNIINE